MSSAKFPTLEEAVASETAQLLMDADDARQLASLAARDVAANLLSHAAALEYDAVKWEQRLMWWNLLRRQQSLRRARKLSAA